MPVIVEIPIVLQGYSNNKKNINLESGNLKKIFTDLGCLFPDLGKMLYNQNGNLKSYISVLHRGKIIKREKFDRIDIADGEKIKLLIPIGGG